MRELEAASHMAAGPEGAAADSSGSVGKTTQVEAHAAAATGDAGAAPETQHLTVMELNAEYWNGLKQHDANPRVRDLHGYGYVNVKHTAALINARKPDIVLLEDMSSFYLRHGNAAHGALSHGFAHYLPDYNVRWPGYSGLMVRKPAKFVGDKVPDVKDRARDGKEGKEKVNHVFAHAKFGGKTLFLGAGQFTSHGDNAIIKAANRRRAAARAAAGKLHDPEQKRAALDKAETEFERAKARANVHTQHQHVAAAKAVLETIRKESKGETVVYGADFNEVHQQAGYRRMRAAAKSLFPNDPEAAAAWAAPKGQLSGKGKHPHAGSLGIFSSAHVENHPELAQHTGDPGQNGPSGTGAHVPGSDCVVHEEHQTMVATLDV